MTLREYLKECKRTAMVPVPWIFPYLGGAAVGIASVSLAFKIRGLVPVHKDLVYVPMALGELMHTTGEPLTATILNSPWNVDLLLKLVPKG